MNSSKRTLLTSDGVRIAYCDEGEGPVALLLHGMLCHSGHWIFQREVLLAAGYRVVSIDLRFHGDSDAPTHGFQICRMAEDVADVIKAAELHDISLIGHSMGVSVALAYISLHGIGAVSRLVAIDQAPRIMNDSTWAWGVRHVEWATFEEQIHGRMTWSEFEREPETPPYVQRLLEEQGMPDDFFASPLALRVDHFVADWRDVLPTIDVPAWVVTGAHSPSFPLEGMEWVAETLPQGRLTVYPNSGHSPHWNEFEDFNRDLLAFLAEDAPTISTGTPSVERASR